MDDDGWTLRSKSDPMKDHIIIIETNVMAFNVFFFPNPAPFRHYSTLGFENQYMYLQIDRNPLCTLINQSERQLIVLQHLLSSIANWIIGIFYAKKKWSETFANQLANRTNILKKTYHIIIRPPASPPICCCFSFSFAHFHVSKYIYKPYNGLITWKSFSHWPGKILFLFFSN